jgi:hypothetical protein
MPGLIELPQDSHKPEDHELTTSPESDSLSAQPSPLSSASPTAENSDTDPNILDLSLPAHRVLTQDVTHSLYVPELNQPETVVVAPKPKDTTTESPPKQTKTQKASPETVQPEQVIIPMESANDSGEPETDREKTSTL